jgi:hypothetical protein
MTVFFSTVHKLWAWVVRNGVGLEPLCMVSPIFVFGVVVIGNMHNCD